MIQPLEQNSKAATRGVFKNFTNFTGKHLCWSLFFTKLQVFRPATLLKKVFLLHRFLPVKLEKFLRTPILKNICEPLLLCIDYFIIYWFLQLTTVHVFHFYKQLLLYYAIKAIELVTCEVVSLEEVSHQMEFLAF